MRFERDTFGISRNPEPCIEFDQGGGEPVEIGIIGRWADIDVDGGMPGVVCRRAAIPPMTTNCTSCSMSTRQMAATCSSLSSGGIACQPVTLCPLPLPGGIVERPLPLGQHRIVVVEVGQLQSQLKPRSSQ